MRVGGYAEQDRTHGALFLTCPFCNRSFVAFIASRNTLTGSFIQGADYAAFKDAVLILGTAPEPPKPRMIDALPDNVRSSFEEAEMNFSDGRMPSAAVGYRRSLERAIRILHPNGKGMLNERIRKLEKENSVPAALIALMDGIKFLGNDGAHDDDDPPKEEVAAGRDFTALLLTYLFELPERVRLAAESRAERRNS